MSVSIPTRRICSRRGDDFEDSTTRHLIHHAEDESDVRNGIQHLPLSNETRTMVSHAFAPIGRIKELCEG